MSRAAWATKWELVSKQKVKRNGDISHGIVIVLSSLLAHPPKTRERREWSLRRVLGLSAEHLRVRQPEGVLY